MHLHACVLLYLVQVAVIIGIAVFPAPSILVTLKVHFIHYNFRTCNVLCIRGQVLSQGIYGILAEMACIIIADITCVKRFLINICCKSAYVHVNLRISLVDFG